MLAYRVRPDLPGALPGSAGHPLYLDTQCSGRLDNPERYQIWYLALEPAGAAAETFGDLDQWDAEMFRCPSVPGSRLALATFRLDDDTALLDLDDARNLYSRGLRPTQVIERNSRHASMGSERLQRAQRPGRENLAGHQMVELPPASVARHRLLARRGATPARDRRT